jgi:CPA1 family monovalent cation:H+ antiporter
VIEADVIARNLDSILVGVAAVVVSRPLAILPLMPVVTRLARLPAVGLRNEFVLVWGGLRGGVALALALSIPDALPDQERLVAMTAGVVLATLILNATTIGPLIRLLGLDRPGRIDRFVADAARFDGARAARAELPGMLANAEIDRQLTDVEEASASEIAALGLSPVELEQALLRRGLAAERASLQELVDEGLVPQWHARVALNALEDRLDELGVGGAAERDLFQARGFGRIVYGFARRIHLGRLTPARWVEVAFRDLHARLRASDDAIAALEHFAGCPGVDGATLQATVEKFRRRHRKALADLEALEATAPADLVAAARRHYSSELARLASARELRHLARLGLCSPNAVEAAGELIARHLEQSERARIEVPVAEEEDVGI